MLTITITLRAVLLAALVAVGALTALYATSALGSSDPPDSIIQGDTDCDGDVDAQDALHNLRYVGGLPVGPFGACPEIGTTAAIPGPPGPQGPQGEPGPQGQPGQALFAVVNSEGELQFGNAVSAMTGSGGSGTFYIVTFDRDISACAAIAANAVSVSAPSPGVTSLTAVLHLVGTGSPDSSSVGVAFRDESTGDFVDTGFHLIVAC